jgi:hypothetical protein
LFWQGHLNQLFTMTTATTRDAHADPACVLAVGLMSLMEHAILHTIPMPYHCYQSIPHHNVMHFRIIGCLRAHHTVLTVAVGNTTKMDNTVAVAIPMTVVSNGQHGKGKQTGWNWNDSKIKLIQR